jgi:hypothetical protein
MIIEIPNAVSSEECQFIKNAAAPFLAASEKNAYNRDGKTVNLTAIPELNEVDVFLLKLFKRVQDNVVQNRYKPPLASADSGYEYHLYGPNEICHYHADHEFSATSGKALLRYASVTLHLNTLHEGGELIFPSQNKKIKTEEGKIVIFPPYGMFGHYTTPSEEPRHVVVTWFVYEGITVNFDGT